MGHALDITAEGNYRMAYRYRSDDDRPWHESETKPKQWLVDPSIEEVILDLEADVDVLLRPVRDCKGRLIPECQETWRPLSDKDRNALVDEEGHPIGRRLGIVGPDYTVLQDHEVIRWFEPWIDSNSCTIETGGAIYGGSRFWVLAKLKQDPVDVVTGDPVEQYVVAINGHGGKIAFRAFPTTVRVVCKNTMQMAMKSKFARLFRAKHLSLVHLKSDQIRLEVAAMQDILLDNVEKFQYLANHDVKDDVELKTYFQKVLKEKVDPDREIKADGKRPLHVLMRLFEEGIGMDIPGVKGSWYAAFNSVTEFCSHLRGRSSDARLDNLITGVGAELNARALDLGLKAASGQMQMVA